MMTHELPRYNKDNIEVLIGLPVDLVNPFNAY
jgi:hypothetical protein